MEKKVVDLYSPFNAKNLTQEQLAAMAEFSKEDLKALSENHNNGSGTAYLVLKDKTKPDNKQTFPLSTWRNLYELHKLGQTNMIAFSYRSIFKDRQKSLKAVPVQDLTKEQAKSELATAGTQKAKADKAPAMSKTAEQVANEEGQGLEGAENDSTVKAGKAKAVPTKAATKTPAKTATPTKAAKKSSK